MRPLELSLEGFTSFRREMRLDFSELDLFAITGATGAGKSSILDAITYALYGNTARTGKQIIDLVSQGAKNLKVQLKFAVGNSQYRVTRRWKYRASTPENKILLEEWKNNEWETLGTSIVAVQKSLEEILGMDFDTFTRVIVLPQGKFDEFLKGDTSKRREILRQLAGFEIFERMRKQAGEMAKLFKQEREMVERQLLEIDAPAPLEIEQKRSQLTTYQQELLQLNQTVLETQKSLNEAENIVTQINKVIQLKGELANLNKNAAAMEELQLRLQTSQLANNLQADWVLVKEARAGFESANKAAESANRAFKEAQKNLQLQQQQLKIERNEYEVIAPQLKAREQALESAKIYEEQRSQYLQEVATAQKAVDEKQRQQQRAEIELQSAQKKLELANRQVAEATAVISQHAPAGNRLEKLTEIASFLVEYQLIETQLITDTAQLEKAKINRQKSENRQREIEEKLKQADAILQQTREQLDAGEKANAEAARLELAAALRIELQPGDTCPVCGGIHPESDRLPLLPASQMIDLMPVRSQLNTALQAFQNWQIEATKAETESLAHRRNENELRQALAATEEKLGHLRRRIDAGVGEGWQAKALEGELQALRAGEEAYRQAEKQLQTASAQLQVAQQAHQFAQQTVAGAQVEYHKAIAQLQQRQLQLQACEDKLFQLTDNQPYSILAQALQREKQELETRLKAVETAYQTAYNQAMLAEERAKQTNVALEAASLKKQQLNAHWEVQLQAANFTEERFLNAEIDPKTQAKWERSIREYRESKIQLETLIFDLTDTLGEDKVNQAYLTQIQQQIEQQRTGKRTAEEMVKLRQQQISEFSAFLQIAEQKLEQTARFLEQQENLLEQEQTYQTLAQNLKSNEFQSYILEHLEAELVARATILLRDLTESRYALTIQDGEYWVEDNWNGGETRRVKTLSGGETFATSLSMALALSEKLSQGAQLGSLFLDEGFGTLDAETLESVTQILESLRQQSRLIGVITHVRALAERLPTQIKVHKSPQGSTIEVEKQ